MIESDDPAGPFSKCIPIHNSEFNADTKEMNSSKEMHVVMAVSSHTNSKGQDGQERPDNGHNRQ